MDFDFEFVGEVGIVCVVFPFIFYGVLFIGNARFVVVTCISYSLLRRKNVLAMGERMHACCLSLER